MEKGSNAPSAGPAPAPVAAPASGTGRANKKLSPWRRAGGQAYREELLRTVIAMNTHMKKGSGTTNEV